jgi:hypothetical protein
VLKTSTAHKARHIRAKRLARCCTGHAVYVYGACIPQSLATVQLSAQQQAAENGLDVLTGWQVADGELRCIAVEGPAGGRGMAETVPAIACWALEDQQAAWDQVAAETAAAAAVRGAARQQRCGAGCSSSAGTPGRTSTLAGSNKSGALPGAAAAQLPPRRWLARRVVFNQTITCAAASQRQGKSGPSVWGLSGVGVYAWCIRRLCSQLAVCLHAYAHAPWAILAQPNH